MTVESSCCAPRRQRPDRPHPRAHLSARRAPGAPQAPGPPGPPGRSAREGMAVLPGGSS